MNSQFTIVQEFEPKVSQTKQINHPLGHQSVMSTAFYLEDLSVFLGQMVPANLNTRINLHSFPYES